MKRQTVDFYLPDYNIAIECQGEQHFKLVPYFDNEESFKLRKKRDKIKNKLCFENNVKLYYFSNVKHKNCITNKNKLLNLITL